MEFLMIVLPIIWTKIIIFGFINNDQITWRNRFHERAFSIAIIARIYQISSQADRKRREWPVIKIQKACIRWRSLESLNCQKHTWPQRER